MKPNSDIEVQESVIRQSVDEGTRNEVSPYHQIQPQMKIKTKMDGNDIQTLNLASGEDSSLRVKDTINRLESTQRRYANRGDETELHIPTSLQRSSIQEQSIESL